MPYYFHHEPTRPSVVARATVADVLRLAGRPPLDHRGWGLCPSHDDTKPSLHVQPSGRGATCFSCGWHGGVLDLVVALGEAKDRADAARWLEERIR